GCGQQKSSEDTEAHAARKLVAAVRERKPDHAVRLGRPIERCGPACSKMSRQKSQLPRSLGNSSCCSAWRRLRWKSNMPNRKRPRHARCNPAVAGVGMSLAVACSAGADFSSGEALGAPDGMGDAVPESYGESELQGVAYVDVEHTRTPDVELSQAIAHVARGGNLDRLAM